MKHSDADYKNKIIQKLKPYIKKGKKILDVGCGDCEDDRYFKIYGLDAYGIDIFKHKNANRILGRKFKLGSIYKIPYVNNSFDYVFCHDVLHHIDENKKRHARYMAGLAELKRVCKKNGKIIILEANRYNPIFYPHMVQMEHHDHFTQKYFKKLCNEAYRNPEFTFFEAHIYPSVFLRLFKAYEKIMESFSFLAPYRAYNLMIAKIE